MPGCFRSLTLAALLSFAPLALAAKEPLDGKFTLRDETLIYDTETAAPKGEAEVTADDIDRLLEMLRANPDIRVLELNSNGGSVYASSEMARIVIDFGLDTIVSGECFSSCVTIFLAGNKRQMMLGSKIGFHQPKWPAAAIENYYETWKDEEGWHNPFELASWIYADTQSEVFEELTYMIGRGVDAGFAVRTKGVRNDDEWYPSRIELMKAGVLRD
ncbi:MAG: hypothetical protein GJ676_10790 [Rhodobacteraceae bacterium]|nr:hypothetical protein [Paracoccaceae bacterium]